MTFLTFLESSGVKPNCRYSEYITIAMKKASWKVSNGFRILNHTSQWLSHWNGRVTSHLTELVSFRHFTLLIAALQFIKSWPDLLKKIKVLLIYGAIGVESLSSSSI